MLQLILALALLNLLALGHVNRRLKTMTEKTAALLLSVASLQTVVASAVAALNGQADQFEAALREGIAAALAADAASDAETEAAVNSAIDTAIAQVRANADALAAAIPQGTVAEDEPEPEPAPADTLPTEGDTVQGSEG